MKKINLLKQQEHHYVLNDIMLDFSLFKRFDEKTMTKIIDDFLITQKISYAELPTQHDFDIFSLILSIYNKRKNPIVRTTFLEIEKMMHYSNKTQARSVIKKSLQNISSFTFYRKIENLMDNTTREIKFSFCSYGANDGNIDEDKNTITIYIDPLFEQCLEIDKPNYVTITYNIKGENNKRMIRFFQRKVIQNRKTEAHPYDMYFRGFMLKDILQHMGWEEEYKENKRKTIEKINVCLRYLKKNVDEFPTYRLKDGMYIIKDYNYNEKTTIEINGTEYIENK